RTVVMSSRKSRKIYWNFLFCQCEKKERKAPPMTRIKRGDHYGQKESSPRSTGSQIVRRDGCAHDVTGTLSGISRCPHAYGSRDGTPAANEVRCGKSEAGQDQDGRERRL